MLLSFAFGGVMVGVLLHQLLRWHHLLSGWHAEATLEQLRFHAFWDGAFHAAHHAILAGGLALLRARARRSGSAGSSWASARGTCWTRW